MRAYVGTILDDYRSVQIAHRCIASGNKYGIDVQIMPATQAETALSVVQHESLKISEWDTSFSDTGAVLGNFLTQYRTWKIIADLDKPSIVLEHDAVFVGPVPELDGHDIVNLGKPSFGGFSTEVDPGTYKFFSKPGYFGGAHAYYLTPNGARSLIRVASKVGAGPCDLFLCTKNFPDLREVYPWPIEAHDSFSTIQRKKGCLRKHNYGDWFNHI